MIETSPSFQGSRTTCTEYFIPFSFPHHLYHLMFKSVREAGRGTVTVKYFVLEYNMHASRLILHVSCSTQWEKMNQEPYCMMQCFNLRAKGLKLKLLR